MRKPTQFNFKIRFLSDIQQMLFNGRYIYHRILLMALLFILLIGCTPNNKKVYRIGILSGVASFSAITDGFQEKMEELGYVEGINVEYDNWVIENNPEEEGRVIQKFIDDQVDLILTYPSRPSILAKKLTQETGIPVVFAGATIEGTDLVNSIREPGGNITGVRFPFPELTAKRFELLLELVPNAQKILFFYDESYPSYSATRAAVDNVLRNKKVTIVEVPVSTVEETKSSLEILEQSGDLDADAIFLAADLFSASSEFWEILKPFGIKHRLPVACHRDNHFEDPCLLLINSNHINLGNLAAVIADKILHGTPPGTIPVSSPELNLYLNYHWAQTLGLEIPEGLLKQAFKVVH